MGGGGAALGRWVEYQGDGVKVTESGIRVHRTREGGSTNERGSTLTSRAHSARISAALPAIASLQRKDII